MPNAVQFRRKIESICPVHLRHNLKPGTVFVAILKPDTNSDSHFDVDDVFWAKCPGTKTIAALLKTFKQVESNDVYLYHNLERLTTDSLVSSLTVRNGVCALEAIYASDASGQRARDGLCRKKTSVTNDSVLQEIKNDAVNRSKALSPLSSKLNSTSKQPKTHTSREWSTPVGAGQGGSQSISSGYGSPISSSGRSSIYGSDAIFLAWADFVYDRREYQSRSDDALTPKRPDHSFDGVVAQEWLALGPNQRQYYVDRSRKGRYQNPREHCAFWGFYYDRSRSCENLGHRPHLDFESSDRFFTDTIAIWLGLDPELRDNLCNLTARDACKVPPLPMGSTLPPAQYSGIYTNQSSPGPAGSSDWPNNNGSLLPSTSDSQTLKDPHQSVLPETSTMSSPADMFQAVQKKDAPHEEIHVDNLFEGRSVEQLEAGMLKGAEILRSIKAQLESESSTELDHWLTIVSNLEKQVTRTKTVVGVVGATGAGKSSVINAILDEERLVPTNCMRACTAVVTEISYNHEDVPYRAEIDFISKEDWTKELETSFQDLFDGTGKVSRECTNEDSEAGIAYAKIKAVYPLMTKENMESTTVTKLLDHANVRELLGGKRSIEENDASLFYKQLQRYVDSKEKTFSREKKTEAERIRARQMEFWPLIRVVRLYVKAPALATGAVIVDLPGVHDSNQARAAVAQGYLKQCTGLWIVAPITRAVDDKSAKTLLGNTFKRQLKMDGGYNSVTFICSKTDDISVTEAQDSLGLDSEMAPLYAKSDELEASKKNLESELQDLKTKRSDIVAAIDSVDEQLEVWEKLGDDLEDGKVVYAPKADGGKRKRRSSSEIEKPEKRTRYSEDSDDDLVANDSDLDVDSADGHATDEERATSEPLTADTINDKISDLKTSKREGRREKTALEQPMTDLKTKIAEIDQERDEIDNKLLGKCIEGRNDYSRGAIQQDFASGIRELDQEIAEEDDAANFNPNVDVRDYEAVAKSLPVFCVSSRGYQQLMGRLTKDKRAAMFQNIEDTEIPALQTHCEKLTVTNREVACKRFLNNLSQFLNSLRLWSSSDGTATHLTDEQKRKEAQFLDSQLRKLDTALENVVKSTCANLSNELDESLYERFPTALQAGKNEALEVQAQWGAPVNRDNRSQGGLYWSTYKAAVRRNGVWSGNDFNNDLVEPVIKQITPGWDKVFSRRLPHKLATFADKVYQTLTNFHGIIEQRSIRAGSNVATFQILKQQLTAHRAVAKDAGTMAQNFINTRQKDINRGFVPAIAEAMTPVYQRTAAEVGPGQYKRMKSDMEMHVTGSRDHMFQDSLDRVKQQLRTMLKDTEDLMMEKVDEVFVATKRDYESIIVGKNSGSEKRVQLSKQQRKTRQEVLGIIDGVESTMRRVVGLESPEPEDSKPADSSEEAKAVGGVDVSDSNGEALPVLKVEQTDEDGFDAASEHNEPTSTLKDEMVEETIIKTEGTTDDAERSSSAGLSETGAPGVKDSEDDGDIEWASTP